jgi:hypothetical protein
MPAAAGFEQTFMQRLVSLDPAIAMGSLLNGWGGKCKQSRNRERERRPGLGNWREKKEQYPMAKHTNTKETMLDKLHIPTSMRHFLSFLV